MTDPETTPTRSALKRAERGLEAAIFNSRWLMAPFYVGLVVSLAVLMLKFLRILYEFVTHAWGASESDIILGVLSLIDVSLTGSLVLIVVFSGYENFVSRIDPAGHPDWPEWMAPERRTTRRTSGRTSIAPSGQGRGDLRSLRVASELRF